MSIYFSRFGLNTYQGTPYFQAHIPADYPVSGVMQKARAFRRLPPNLRKLAENAKQWAKRVYGEQIVDEWYDDDGYELDPSTGKRLTDEEIDAQWGAPNETLAKLNPGDIPIPDGGFPDPDTWEMPAPKVEQDEDDDSPTEEQLLSDIRERGREYVAKEYGVSAKSNFSDKALARAILSKVGR